MNSEIEYLTENRMEEFIPDKKLLLFDQFRYSILLNDVHDVLDDLGCVIIKGEVLSLMAYGSLGIRKSSDIDILIPRKNVKTLEKILISKGYVHQLDIVEERAARILCMSSSHQLMSFYKKSKGVNIQIDVNFDILWGEYTGKRIDIDEFISDRMRMDLFGYKVNVLKPDKALIQLILHHYKEMNSIFILATRNSINYKMFRDVYYLWKNNKESIPLDNFYNTSSKYGIVPYVYFVFYYTNCIFKDEKLKEFVRKFETPEGVRLLNSYGLSDKERKCWKNDFKKRLKTDNLYKEIEKDMTLDDIKKINLNKNIFIKGT